MTRTLTPEHAQRRARLPRRLALLMRPELPSLSQEIIEEVRRSIPEYGRPLRDPHVEALRIGVERALMDFVDQVANPHAPRERHHETYRRLGRFEAQEGRTLDTLQAALRIGAQVAWRRIMKVGPRRARVARGDGAARGRPVRLHRRAGRARAGGLHGRAAGRRGRGAPAAVTRTAAAPGRGPRAGRGRRTGALDDPGRGHRRRGPVGRTVRPRRPGR
ncbi:hypothetical protein LUX33_38495 [Actinomadura madurae]|uniref:hypothetical protein n=1 Tax=Actinomadura madurae TaxID=1993 RepID=UPI0020D22245|nr:hypothetical protein [Actinomadura madurae]MCP9953747.1 hypothetical protein [Actinomadura madurae]